MSARFDGNPDALVDDVAKRWAAKDPTLGLFVGIDGEDIVGHVLAFVREHDGRWVGWLCQVEHDRRARRPLIDACVAVLTDWIEMFNFAFANHGIHVDSMMFQTPHMNDMWGRHSGFTPHRYLMIRKIPLRAKK